MVKLFEADGYFLADVLLLFILTTFNQELGILYMAMIIFDYLLYQSAIISSSYKPIPLEANPNNRLWSVITATGLFVAFYFAVAYIQAAWNHTTADPTKLGQTIASTFSATPILYGSNYLKLVIWGLLLAIIESRFFFRSLMQWGTVNFARIHVPENIMQPSAWIIAAVFGAIFMVFHIAAKQITDNNALFVTFLFGMFSVLTVIQTREVIIAIFLHILWNSIGVMYSLNIGFAESTQSGIILTASLILIAWIVLFFQIPFISPHKGVI